MIDALSSAKWGTQLGTGTCVEVLVMFWRLPIGAQRGAEAWRWKGTARLLSPSLSAAGGSAALPRVKGRAIPQHGWSLGVTTLHVPA